MIRNLFLVFILSCATAFAAEAPASAESIREVLKVTDAKGLIDKMWPQIDATMAAAMQQALKGKKVSPQQQETLSKMQAKMIASMKEDLSWENLEPMYVEIYQKSFTQTELDGMLAFYKSPAGAAVVKKMPIVMQETMIAMRQKLGPMMQKMQRTVQESASEIQKEQPSP